MLKILNILVDDKFIDALIEVFEATKGEHTHDYIIIDNKEKNINLAIKNMDNLARMQGFNDSNDVEEYYKNFSKN